MEVDFINITIVGLGLIGGSIAKSLSKNKKYKIYAIDTNKNTIEKAYKDMVIHNNVVEETNLLEKSDVTIICLYPNDAIEFIKKNMKNFKSNSIITDTCGLKTKILSSIKNIIRRDITFIGGHPMAGRELNGYDNSYAKLFDGSNYILVNTEGSESRTHELIEIISDIGNINIVISKSSNHDNMVAYTSHLPHILACALSKSPYNYKAISNFSGGSFKDSIRVGDINSMLWTDLILDNKENLIDSIEMFEENLRGIKSIIKNGNRNELMDTLNESKKNVKLIKGERM
ncbi:prephenate dehydrogenase [Helicovermis profundi]|uniref:Prephenate dehydrogenase n=1 Tax=Helicovermis profundi TaxID=3065157 RepID=A0AAU9ED87_9FIRM|nr:prephenate dehydrogenase [Clostridia bacterium S502]